MGQLPRGYLQERRGDDVVGPQELGVILALVVFAIMVSGVQKWMSDGSGDDERPGPA